MSKTVAALALAKAASRESRLLTESQLPRLLPVSGRGGDPWGAPRSGACGCAKLKGTIRLLELLDYATPGCWNLKTRLVYFRKHCGAFFFLQQI